ncbi:MAG: zinc ABC transporter substrate-binding protein [Candidatus Zixiibacteriota bacterium]
MTRIRTRLMYGHVLLYTFVLLALLVAPSAIAKVKAFVSIAPQGYFVSEIGRDLVDVEILVPPAQSPATYEPTPQQLSRMATADVLFTAGVPFESRLIDKIEDEFKDLEIVETHREIRLRPIEHHDDSDHGHEGILDPHVWLDPKLAAIEARTIAEALSVIDTVNSLIYADHLENLLERMDSVDNIVRGILAPLRGRTMFVFHPAYGYFCDAYGLRQVAIETGGKEPSARQLAAIVEQARKDRVDVVFVQPQFSKRQAESVGQAIGATMVTLDPLSGDYLNNLVDMARKIVQALGNPDSQIPGDSTKTEEL